MELSPNQAKIINMLMECNGNGITRGLMYEHLKIPWTTLYDNLVILQQENIVEKYSKKTNKSAGPPFVFWRLKD